MRIVKYHVSMSYKLGLRVPRWKRNDSFLRAFVKRLLFFASHMVSAVGNVARDSTSWARRRSASARGQSVWAAAEGRGRRADLTCQPQVLIGGGRVGFIGTQTHLPQKFGFSSDFGHFILKMFENAKKTFQEKSY